MPVTVARHAGFCIGVQKAVEAAMRAADAAKREALPCWSLGEVIHNPCVVEELKARGVRVVASPDEAQGGYIILRSHGESQSVYARCEALGLQIVDCTCPFVRSVHKAVADYSSQGAPVIIVGDASHPEVRGTAGWCKGEVYVVSSDADIDALPPIERALAVSQTTLPQAQWEERAARLRQKVPMLTEKPTICQATDERLASAKELAVRADCMVVVGGARSANTRKLFEACSQLCPRTCLVERAADIPPHFADIHTQHIGIAAGASTPDWSLKEVVNAMNDMEHKEQALAPETEEQTTEAEAVVQEAAPVSEQAEAAQAQPQAEAPVEAIEEAPKKELTDEEKRNQRFMDDVEATLVRIRTGQTVTGTVVQITDEEVCVNIGYKSDGLIKRSDLVDEDVKLGDEIEVEVVKVNDGEGNVLLSQRNIVNRKAWEALMAKYEAGEYVDAVGKEAVKGGLIAQVDGIRAFIPASLLAQRYVEKIGQFIGQPMRIKIIEVDKAKKRIVASRKHVIEEESAAKKAAAWERIVEGEIITGIVRRFADFGAFVDLGGVDGLIHITDLAWSRVGHPSEILSINQEVEVKVLSVDRERERIQLGYKQLRPRPWDNIEEKYPIGIVLERKVVRIRTFGAFVELEPGVDGLVHISQCALTRIAKVEEVLTPGQMVKVKVLSVDPEAKRIGLSIREVLEDEAFNYAGDIPGEEPVMEDEYVEADIPAEETVVEETPSEE